MAMNWVQWEEDHSALLSNALCFGFPVVARFFQREVVSHDSRTIQVNSLNSISYH